ncbi:porin family protein [Dysgonomonas sp. BGC7]|uniref:porin family protein n=1 Tax=Dysgonomonas sp. BGC7 TaxID=1658008 RepID=UPI000681DA9B|nr:porin family protein [Dysgonomonas sp. BGC7]MBD8390206.1 PorT family protein [Dysgonomonas sp. BGC7]
MKTAFKIFLLTVLLLFVFTDSYAQRERRRFTSDIHLGLNLAEMDIQGGNMYKEPKVGLQFGANLNFKVIRNFQIQTGLFVTKRGLRQHIIDKKVDQGANVMYVGDTLRVKTANYIQVPLCIGYELYLTKTFAFNINVGVYGAYGFKGKSTEEGFLTTHRDGAVITSTVTENETETFGLTRWRRFDYGGIAKVGFIYDIYTINFGYEYGMYNVADSGADMKNRNMTVSLGFRF